MLKIGILSNQKSWTYKIVFDNNTHLSYVVPYSIFNKKFWDFSSLSILFTSLLSLFLPKIAPNMILQEKKEFSWEFLFIYNIGFLVNAEEINYNKLSCLHWLSFLYNKHHTVFKITVIISTRKKMSMYISSYIAKAHISKFKEF